MINKNSPVPLYYQLAQVIKDAIDNGEIKPGDSIPTESELMKKYGISRATTRQAILQLVSKGYLRRIKGKGTFVNTPPKSRFLSGLKCFSEEMNQRGIPHFSKVLAKAIIPSPIRVAEKLQVAPGASVFYLKRLRFAYDTPVLIVENYVPAHLCPGIENEDFECASLYDLLERRYGLILHHGRREVESAMPSSKEEAALLGISPKTCILYVESIVYTEDDTPVEYFECKMCGRFEVEVLRK